MNVKTLGLAAVLAGVGIAGYAHANIPNPGPVYFLNTPKPVLLFGRLIDTAGSRGGIKREISFIRYRYDRNGDGAPDIEFYHRFCGNIVSGNPYLTIDHFADRLEVDRHLDGINKIVLKKSEADAGEITAKAPACK